MTKGVARVTGGSYEGGGAEVARVQRARLFGPPGGSLLTAGPAPGAALGFPGPPLRRRADRLRFDVAPDEVPQVLRHRRAVHAKRLHRGPGGPRSLAGDHL